MSPGDTPHRPTIIQAALNGIRSRRDHARVPLTIDELMRDAAECVAAGAGAIHLHPRDRQGQEMLDPAVVDEVASAVRAWRTPDYSSVNLSEPGSVEIMSALLAAGVGIEAGVSTVADVDQLIASGLADSVTRILVEPGEEQVGTSDEAALALVAEIHAMLDRYGVTAPRLQHGDGAVTWPLLRDAFRRGIDTRIGLEDTPLGPHGTVTAGNEALVRAAVQLRDGR